MEEIRTQRLLLRPFRNDDYDDLYEFLSQLKDDEFEPYPEITFESARELLDMRIESGAFYAVELLETGKVIGNISCDERGYNAREVGYIINKDYQKMGYATEALKAVIDKAFRDGAHRVFSELDTRNTASMKLVERVGMKREAHLRQNIWFWEDENGDPIWKDTYIYALLESDL